MRAGWQAEEARDDILASYRVWIGEATISAGLTPDDAYRCEIIVPSDMCVDGLLRYFEKSEA